MDKQNISVKFGWLLTIIFTTIAVFINLGKLPQFEHFTWMWNAMNIWVGNGTIENGVSITGLIWSILFCWTVGPFLAALAICVIIATIYLLAIFIARMFKK